MARQQIEKPSKVLAAALASVQEPIQHFIDTGLFVEPRYQLIEGVDASVGMTQVRRICRHVAGELRRPFIVISDISTMHERVNGSWVTLDEPVWSHAHITMPRRKYLVPLMAPLVLGDKTKEIQTNWDTPNTSLWTAVIRDRSIWTEYYDRLLNDPDMRRARRTPVL
jgi:hypothetical protein